MTAKEYRQLADDLFLLYPRRAALMAFIENPYADRVTVYSLIAPQSNTEFNMHVRDDPKVVEALRSFAKEEVERVNQRISALENHNNAITMTPGPPPDGAMGLWLIEIQKRYMAVVQWYQDGQQDGMYPGWYDAVRKYHANVISAHWRIRVAPVFGGQDEKKI